MPVLASTRVQKSMVMLYEVQSVSRRVAESSVRRMMETMQMLRSYGSAWGGRALMVEQSGMSRTYKKPKEKRVTSISFWFLGAARMPQMTGSGSRKMRKSVAIWMPKMI